jgi:GGDEF domain-containing protein
VRHITVHRRGGVNESISLSGAFACALLLHYDWSLVVLALALASVVDDCKSRSGWWKTAFNASQYTLSLVAAAGVLSLLGGTPDGSTADSLPVLVSLATCAVFFLVNTALPGVLIALLEHTPVLRSLRDDLPLQWSVNGVVVAMAPLVVAVANDSLWLVGLLVVPVLAVHRGAVSALEREHMTLHDPLTGLPNQIAFQQRLVEQLEAATDGEHVAVLVLALDHMDDVSNTLGPSAAEELLEQVARRLRTTVPGGRRARPQLRRRLRGRRARACARRGRPAPAPRRCSRSSATRTTSSSRPSPCGRASASPSRRCTAPTPSSSCSTPRSPAASPCARARPRDLQRRAQRLHRAPAGRPARARPGAAPPEMTVHFQPQVQVATGQVTATRRSCAGTTRARPVSPDEFVALAEHAGMMHEVTDYVLDEALRRVAEWRGRARPRRSR